MRSLLCSVLCLLLALGQLAVADPKPKPKPADEKLSFVVYGDTRSYANDHRKVVVATLRQHPDFVLQSGDLVNDGSSPADWSEFANITQPFRDAHVAYYPARGNHDVGPRFMRWVPQPAQRSYYAFTRQNNRFIVLDTCERFSPGSLQLKWLESELAAAAKTATNTFVLLHEGPYSVGPHGGRDDVQRYAHPLFVKYRPRAVFCGHDHLYYRTTRDGVAYFVTGGGGAPLYQPERWKQVAINGDVFSSVHHILRCDVTGSHLTVTVIALDRDTTLDGGWSTGDRQPKVTLLTTSGPHTIDIQPHANGTMIDRVQL